MLTITPAGFKWQGSFPEKLWTVGAQIRNLVQKGETKKLRAPIHPEIII